MVLEAGYPHPTGRGFRKIVKASIMIKKKAGMSDADFVEHYNYQHAMRAKDVLKRHGCLKYSITYHLDRDRKIMQDMLRGTAQVLDYDAICTFEFPDYRSFAKFMYDPEGKALAGDHDNFMVESEMRLMVGDEFVVFGEGSKAEEWKKEG